MIFNLSTAVVLALIVLASFFKADAFVPYTGVVRSKPKWWTKGQIQFCYFQKEIKIPNWKLRLRLGKKLFGSGRRGPFVCLLSSFPIGVP